MTAPADLESQLPFDFPNPFLAPFKNLSTTSFSPLTDPYIPPPMYPVISMAGYGLGLLVNSPILSRMSITSGDTTVKSVLGFNPSLAIISFIPCMARSSFESSPVSSYLFFAVDAMSSARSRTRSLLSRYCLES